MQAGPRDPTHWLTQTRLLPPPLRADVLSRPRLVQSLHDALLSHSLTLVSAPAGYGKTTLLSALNAVLSGGPVAWLSLDPEDNDPARFFTAVVAALRRVFPDCGAATLSVLAGHGMPLLDPRFLAGVLVNDVLAAVTAPSVLVLDDLHLVSEPMVYVAMDHFLDRLPPQFHVVIAARHDPPLSLARLRARGELAEFRLADLRFTAEETALLLNGRLRLHLPDDRLTHLYERTEGWPVGLRLLASSLEGMPSAADRSAFLADLGRGDRHIFEFLAAEVLDRQDPSLGRFLLETAILPELTAAVCRAVTGRDDAGAVLEDLDRRGLFVTPVDMARTVFRYHALFAEFLQQRLQRELPDRLQELHRRAAQATTAPGRAVGHFLAAGEWEEAAALVEQLAEPLLRAGLAGTVAGWIQGLPVAVRDRRPGLWLLLGVSAFQQSDLPAAREHLESALHAFEAASDTAGTDETLTRLATCAFVQADFAGARALVARALARPVPPTQRMHLLMTRCWLAVFRGDLAEAAVDLEGALAAAQEAGTPDAHTALVFQLKPDLALLPGGLERMERCIREASPGVGPDLAPAGMALQELVTFVHFWRGRVDQALQVCRAALAQAERAGGYLHIGPHTAAFGGLACLVRQDYPAAERLLERGIAQAGEVPLGQVAATGWPRYLLGRLRLLQGDLAGARAVAEQMGAAAGGRENVYAPVLRLRLQGCLDLAEGRYAAAERALREALAQEARLPVLRLAGTARVSLARLAYAQNRPEAALAELAPVLAACEEQDTPGLILTDGVEAAPVLRLAVQRGIHAAFARRLLDLLVPTESHPLTVVPETGAVLSSRELEVLALLAAGASNRHIAARLVITETTVKTHVRHLFQKLNVASRTQAAARARALGLPLSPSDR